MIQNLIESGRVADLVLVIMALEAIVVGTVLARQGRMPTLLRHGAGLLAGVGLVLALRASLTHSPWPMIALFLTLAFLAHATEIVVMLLNRR
jgi:hypothetical protein